MSVKRETARARRCERRRWDDEGRLGVKVLRCCQILERVKARASAGEGSLAPHLAVHQPILSFSGRDANLAARLGSRRGGLATTSSIRLHHNLAGQRSTLSTDHITSLYIPLTMDMLPAPLHEHRLREEKIKADRAQRMAAAASAKAAEPKKPQNPTQAFLQRPPLLRPNSTGFFGNLHQGFLRAATSSPTPSQQFPKSAPVSGSSTPSNATTPNKEVNHAKLTAQMEKYIAEQKRDADMPSTKIRTTFSTPCTYSSGSSPNITSRRHVDMKQQLQRRRTAAFGCGLPDLADHASDQICPWKLSTRLFRSMTRHSSLATNSRHSCTKIRSWCQVSTPPFPQQSIPAKNKKKTHPIASKLAQSAPVLRSQRRKSRFIARRRAVLCPARFSNGILATATSRGLEGKRGKTSSRCILFHRCVSADITTPSQSLHLKRAVRLAQRAGVASAAGFDAVFEERGPGGADER
nr:hypothetical protein CFP56_46820 [Quercus suber]